MEDKIVLWLCSLFGLSISQTVQTIQSAFKFLSFVIIKVYYTGTLKMTIGFGAPVVDLSRARSTPPPARQKSKPADGPRSPTQALWFVGVPQRSRNPPAFDTRNATWNFELSSIRKLWYYTYKKIGEIVKRLTNKNLEKK